MPIRKIEIENLRCFEKVDLDFTRPDGSLSGFTVLAGRNGSGKSTLLKAIVLGFAASRAEVLEPSLRSWIRTGSSNQRSQLKVETSGSVVPGLILTGNDQGVDFGIVVERNLLSELMGRNRIANFQLYSPDQYSPDSPNFDLIGLEETLRVHQEKIWKSFPLLAYGPYRRLAGQGSEAQRLLEGPVEIARVASLFREDVSLIESVTWLREVYLRRLENSSSHADLEKAILALLDDGLLPDGASVDRIDSDGLWVRQHGVELNLKELSDGYRTVAALVLDIVRHLHIAYGRVDIEKVKVAGRLQQRIMNEAVVLIDEIEMHLHISWQQRIGFWLKEHFPNVQFLVTTHSPFVCQAADPGGLIRLPAPGEKRPVERVSDELYYTVVNGSLDEAVLSELFGLESPFSAEAEILRDEVADIESRLIAGTATARQRKKLSGLRGKLPHSMSSDVEIAVRSLEKK